MPDWNNTSDFQMIRDNTGTKGQVDRINKRGAD